MADTRLANIHKGYADVMDEDGVTVIGAVQRISRRYNLRDINTVVSHWRAYDEDSEPITNEYGGPKPFDTRREAVKAVEELHRG